MFPKSQFNVVEYVRDCANFSQFVFDTRFPSIFTVFGWFSPLLIILCAITDNNRRSNWLTFCNKVWNLHTNLCAFKVYLDSSLIIYYIESVCDTWYHKRRNFEEKERKTKHNVNGKPNNETQTVIYWYWRTIILNIAFQALLLLWSKWKQKTSVKLLKLNGNFSPVVFSLSQLKKKNMIQIIMHNHSSNLL